MTDTTASQVALFVAALTIQDVDGNYPTNAKRRVYAPRDWPSWDKIYPALFLSAPLERKEGLGRNTAPQFFTTSTIRISGRVSEPAAIGDVNAGLAEAELWILQRQYEIAVINAVSIMPHVQQIKSVTTRLAYSSEGATHLAGIMTDIEVEFYQGAEDFAPVPATPIETIGIKADLANVADPTGIYVPPFAYPVTPEPRTHGPDGRVEVSADIATSDS